MTKILILTTETIHHNFFVNRLLDYFPDITVVVETDLIKPKYDTIHEFENIRNDYERKLWKDYLKSSLKDICTRYITCCDINDKTISQKINTLEFDVCIVFGTRKIGSDLISKLPFNTFNLHGGDPRLYRGLDSHLWSIWHKDLRGLKTCIHRLNNKLDHGDIFQLKELNINQIDSLYQLRALNTEKCIDISLLLLKNLKDDIDVSCKPQTHLGRYYSFMPVVLKEQCILRFKKLKNLSATNEI